MQDLPPANFEAFARRLAAMRLKLHRYCARMTGSVIDGEDVVQEAIVKAIEAFAGETVIDNVEAWVFRIAHNCALDLLRRRARQELWITETPLEEIADPDLGAEHRLATAASLRTFMQLLPAQRAAVILMDVLGYSLQEIAVVLGVSVASVKASLHRGRGKLRELAAEPTAALPPVLDAADLRQLSLYVERFNAHDFDSIRAMLAEDVRLDLVNRVHWTGKALTSRYFGNYSDANDWRLEPGWIETQPAIIVRDSSAAPVYFMLIEWAGDSVSRIVDYRHARYVVEAAELTALP
jgi:RNA polymerase sigma-70 factor (ECF subfamily)